MPWLGPGSVLETYSTMERFRRLRLGSSRFSALGRRMPMSGSSSMEMAALHTRNQKLELCNSPLANCRGHIEIIITLMGGIHLPSEAQRSPRKPYRPAMLSIMPIGPHTVIAYSLMPMVGLFLQVTSMFLMGCFMVICRLRRELVMRMRSTVGTQRQMEARRSRLKQLLQLLPVKRFMHTGHPFPCQHTPSLTIQV